MDPIPPAPPRERSHCPNHCEPLLYAGTFDGEHSYECPAARCSVTLFVPIFPSDSQPSALSSQLPPLHEHDQPTP